MGRLSNLVGNSLSGGGSDFDSTNVDDGILQTKRSNAKADAPQPIFLPGTILPAIVMKIVGPTKEPNYHQVYPLTSISSPLSSTTEQYYKIYFRVIAKNESGVGFHDNIPMPPSFESMLQEASGKDNIATRKGKRPSPLKPEAQDDLYISCHPSMYVASSKITSVIPSAGDKIFISFNDFSFSTATFQGLDQKGLNGVSNPLNQMTMQQAFDTVQPMTTVGDLATLNFKQTKFEGGNCQGAEDGSLKKLAEEIGFRDPYVLVAIRMKESLGDPTAFRFEPHIFLSRGRSNSSSPRNELTVKKNNAQRYGYKLNSVYVVNSDGSVSKRSWYMPADATYDPDSPLTYFQQIKPHLDDPNGAVQTKGGIRYAPRKGFFAFGPKKIATYKGSQVTAYTTLSSYTSSPNDNEFLHIRDAAFLKAYSFDPARAIKSTSWGKYQVMGWALLRLFNNDPKAALDAFLSEPDRIGDLMLKGFFSRFDKKPALDAVNSDYPNAPSAKSWNTFAKLYNGPRCCGGGSKIYDISIAQKYLQAKQKCDIKDSATSYDPLGPNLAI